MKQLDPKAVWLFFISLIFRWFVVLLIPAFYLMLLLPAFFASPNATDTPVSFGFLWWLLLIIPALLIFFFIWARLTYRFYRYELMHDGFRKELGVIWKKYVTIPYERIQNVDIYRGIVARILGLSDLHIQTAGASAQYSRYGASGLSAEGRLPGLSRQAAEQIRDELIRRAKGSKNQGL